MPCVEHPQCGLSVGVAVLLAWFATTSYGCFGNTDNDVHVASLAGEVEGINPSKHVGPTPRATPLRHTLIAVVVLIAALDAAGAGKHAAEPVDIVAPKTWGARDETQRINAVYRIVVRISVKVEVLQVWRECRWKAAQRNPEEAQHHEPRQAGIDLNRTAHTGSEVTPTPACVQQWGVLWVLTEKAAHPRAVIARAVVV